MGRIASSPAKSAVVRATLRIRSKARALKPSLVTAISRSFRLSASTGRHYPDFLRTWGDHIKIRRLDLRLTKRALAKRFGIDDVMIYLWEKNRVKPSLAQIPKIIEFLGRDPFEKEPENLGDRILEYRRVHGLSQKKLAEQLRVDQVTLSGWERGEHKPSKNLLLNLEQFFATFPPSFS